MAEVYPNMRSVSSGLPGGGRRCYGERDLEAGRGVGAEDAAQLVGRPLPEIDQRPEAPGQACGVELGPELAVSDEPADAAGGVSVEPLDIVGAGGLTGDARQV